MIATNTSCTAELVGNPAGDESVKTLAISAIEFARKALSQVGIQPNSRTPPTQPRGHPRGPHPSLDSSQEQRSFSSQLSHREPNTASRSWAGRSYDTRVGQDTSGASPAVSFKRQRRSDSSDSGTPNKRARVSTNHRSGRLPPPALSPPTYPTPGGLDFAHSAQFFPPTSLINHPQAFAVVFYPLAPDTPLGTPLETSSLESSESSYQPPSSGNGAGKRKRPRRRRAGNQENQQSPNQPQRAAKMPRHDASPCPAQ